MFLSAIECVVIRVKRALKNNLFRSHVLTYRGRCSALTEKSHSIKLQSSPTLPILYTFSSHFQGSNATPVTCDKPNKKKKSHLVKVFVYLTYVDNTLTHEL